WRLKVEPEAAALVGGGVEHAYAGKQGVERSAEGERLVRQRVELGERRAADRISGSEYRGIRAAGIDVDDRVFEEARGREACGAVGADEGLNGPGDPDGDGDAVAVRVGRREQFDPGDRPDRPSCEPDGRAGYEPGRGGIGDDEGVGRPGRADQVVEEEDQERDGDGEREDQGAAEGAPLAAGRAHAKLATAPRTGASCLERTMPKCFDSDT